MPIWFQISVYLQILLIYCMESTQANIYDVNGRRCRKWEYYHEDYGQCRLCRSCSLEESLQPENMCQDGNTGKREGKFYCDRGWLAVCPILPDVPHGKIVCSVSKIRLVIGARCKLVCNHGYHASHDIIRTCTWPDLTWDNNPAECLKNPPAKTTKKTIIVSTSPPLQRSVGESVPPLTVTQTVITTTISKSLKGVTNSSSLGNVDVKSASIAARQEGKNKKIYWTVIGSALGVLFILVVICVIFYLRKRKRRGEIPDQHADIELGPLRPGGVEIQVETDASDDEDSFNSAQTTEDDLVWKIREEVPLGSSSVSSGDHDQHFEAQGLALAGHSSRDGATSSIKRSTNSSNTDVVNGYTVIEMTSTINNSGEIDRKLMSEPTDTDPDIYCPEGAITRPKTLAKEPVEDEVDFPSIPITETNHTGINGDEAQILWHNRNTPVENPASMDPIPNTHRLLRSDSITMAKELVRVPVQNGEMHSVHSDHIDSSRCQSTTDIKQLSPVAVEMSVGRAEHDSTTHLKELPHPHPSNENDVVSLERNNAARNLNVNFRQIPQPLLPISRTQDTLIFDAHREPLTPVYEGEKIVLHVKPKTPDVNIPYIAIWEKDGQMMCGSTLVFDPATLGADGWYRWTATLLDQSGRTESGWLRVSVCPVSCSLVDLIRNQNSPHINSSSSNISSLIRDVWSIFRNHLEDQTNHPSDRSTDRKKENETQLNEDQSLLSNQATRGSIVTGEDRISFRNHRTPTDDRSIATNPYSSTEIRNRPSNQNTTCEDANLTLVKTSDQRGFFQDFLDYPIEESEEGHYSPSERSDLNENTCQMLLSELIENSELMLELATLMDPSSLWRSMGSNLGNLDASFLNYTEFYARGFQYGVQTNCTREVFRMICAMYTDIRVSAFTRFLSRKCRADVLVIIQEVHPRCEQCQGYYNICGLRARRPNQERLQTKDYENITGARNCHTTVRDLCSEEFLLSMARAMDADGRWMILGRSIPRFSSDFMEFMGYHRVQHNPVTREVLRHICLMEPPVRVYSLVVWAMDRKFDDIIRILLRFHHGCTACQQQFMR